MIESAQGYTLCWGKCIGLHSMLGNGGPSGLGGWVYDRKCTGLYPVFGNDGLTGLGGGLKRKVRFVHGVGRLAQDGYPYLRYSAAERRPVNSNRFTHKIKPQLGEMCFIDICTYRLLGRSDGDFESCFFAMLYTVGSAGAGGNFVFVVCQRTKKEDWYSAAERRPVNSNRFTHKKKPQRGDLCFM
jgi:hypothetical protein